MCETKIEKDSVYNTGLRIEDLSVWTPEEKSWLRRKVVKPKQIILNNVTACIKEGEFLAILGPSGAGKTTLLTSLAGRSALPRSGSVRLRGAPVERLPRGCAELVPQLEVFSEYLSVAEHLRFMASLKLGSREQPQVQRELALLAAEMRLRRQLDTPVRCLSGGERRLLSLASALLSKPVVIICDEPTSGLDSYSALLVISTLKRLSVDGMIVVCSIHQPSSVLFQEFTSLMLMADGGLVFHGTPPECANLFESINLKCPKNYNPAEFYIKAVSVDPRTGGSHCNVIQDQYRKHRRKLENRSANRITDCQEPTVPHTSLRSFHISKRKWFVQVWLLIWRSSLSIKREIKQHFFKLVTGMVISSVIIGTCYAGVVASTQTGIQDTQGLLWLLTSEVAYGLAYNALYAFEADLVVFRREVGLYCSSAFFVAKLICFLPKCVLWPSVFVSVATAALPVSGAEAAWIVAALFGTAIASTAYGLHSGCKRFDSDSITQAQFITEGISAGLGMGGLFSSSKLLGDVMPCMDMPLYLASGVFLRLSSAPAWVQVLRYCSQFYYGLDAINNIYWRNVEHIECPSNSTQCIPDGLSVLTQSGYSDNYVIQDSLGLLMVTIGWSILGYIGLKREERRGYAY